ncbi:MAG: hypothetical protein JWR38_4615 [Mucilaginibacter sp.]|nr:hypothetical protein [Mucilaginibacter sp.]
MPIHVTTRSNHYIRLALHFILYAQATVKKFNYSIIGLLLVSTY